MTARPWLFLAVGASLALTAPAHACSNVYGIPSECRMRVVAVYDQPGHPALTEVASVRVDGNWAYAACSPSPDGQVNVVFDARDELEVHHQGRRRRLKRDGRSYTSVHSIEWDASGRRFGFFAPRGADGAARIGVVDVRAMADNPPYRIVFTQTTGSHVLGFTWAAGEDALLVAERRPEGETALVRADVATGELRELMAGDAPSLDFFVAAHEPASGSRRVLVGTLEGLAVVDVVTGERRLLPVPALAIHHVDLFGDGRRAALFYRRPVPGPGGRTFAAGIHLVDIDAALAGADDAVEHLYDGADVHTLWSTRDGRQVLWATPDAVFTRRAHARGEPPRVLRPPGSTPEGEVKGAAFDRSGTRIAYTVGKKLHVADLASGRSAEVASFAGRFCGHPWWSGDRLVITVFQDVANGTPGSLLVGEPTNGPSGPDGVASTASVTPAAPPVTPAGIEASVMVVQRDSNPPTVTLTVGSDDGVAPGAVFTIRRGAQRVGRVVVRHVEAASCTCEVLETTDGEAIQLGDAATSE